MTAAKKGPTRSQEMCPTLGKMGGKMVVPRAKRRSDHPVTRGFVPMGHPPPRAGGFILGFVASQAVKWSEKDYVSSSTRQGHLFRQGWRDNLVSLRTSSGDLSGSVAPRRTSKLVSKLVSWRCDGGTRKFR